MKIFGNIIWFILGGWLMFLAWSLIGLLYCATIIGFPFGLQCFKLAGLSAIPFGRTVTQPDQGMGHLLGNIIWIIFGGLGLALGHIFFGIFFYATIIGIPFGKQQFKLAYLSLAPFGVHIT